MVDQSEDAIRGLLCLEAAQQAELLQTSQRMIGGGGRLDDLDGNGALERQTADFGDTVGNFSGDLTSRLIVQGFVAGRRDGT